jgi:uncharacterized protein (TIGR02246 family)
MTSFLKSVFACMALAGFAAGAAQAEPLTALDYIQIEQLYAHYAHYLDTADGERFAGLFTPDGVFITNKPDYGNITGRKALADFAAKAGAPPPIVRAGHSTTTVMIDPAPGGATGSAYLMAGTGADQGYVYTDTFVKTKDGWRFKTRDVRQNTPETKDR